MLERSVLLVGIIILGFGMCTLAEGVDEGSFARDGIGARAIGIGGSFVAMANDASAGFWNPSGLTSMDGCQLGGMYTNRFGIEGVSFQYLSLLAKPFTWFDEDLLSGRLPSFGVGFTWINSRVSGIPYSDGDGEGGTFSDDQSLFLVSLAVPLSAEARGWQISLGANLKYYRHSILEGLGSGLGADLGLLFSGTIWDIPLFFGAMSMDTGETRVQWRGTEHNPDNYVPWVWKFGMAARFMEESLLLSTDVDFCPDHSELDRVHTGVEFSLIEQLAFRGGLIIWRDGTRRFSAGLGIKPFEGLTIDYAYVISEYAALENTHIISVDFSIPPFEFPFLP